MVRVNSCCVGWVMWRDVGSTGGVVTLIFATLAGVTVASTLTKLLRRPPATSTER